MSLPESSARDIWWSAYVQFSGLARVWVIIKSACIRHADWLPNLVCKFLLISLSVAKFGSQKIAFLFIDLSNVVDASYALRNNSTIWCERKGLSVAQTSDWSLLRPRSIRKAGFLRDLSIMIIILYCLMQLNAGNIEFELPRELRHSKLLSQIHAWVNMTTSIHQICLLDHIALTCLCRKNLNFY